MSAFRGWSNGLIIRLAKWILRHRLKVYYSTLHIEERESGLIKCQWDDIDRPDYSPYDLHHGRAMGEHQGWRKALQFFEASGLGLGED